MLVFTFIRLSLIGFKWITALANRSVVVFGISMGVGACRTNPWPREHPLNSPLESPLPAASTSLGIRAGSLMCACAERVKAATAPRISASEVSGKDPFCCSGESQQVWVLQVPGVLSVSHPVAFAHRPSWPSSLWGGTGAAASLGSAFVRSRGAPGPSGPHKGHPSSWRGETLVSSWLEPGLAGSGSMWHRVIGAGSQTWHLPDSLLPPTCTWAKKPGQNLMARVGLSHSSPSLQ